MKFPGYTWISLPTCAKKETHAGGSLCICRCSFSCHGLRKPGFAWAYACRRPRSLQQKHEDPPAWVSTIYEERDVTRFSKVRGQERLGRCSSGFEPEKSAGETVSRLRGRLMLKRRPTQVGLCVFVGAALAATAFESRASRGLMPAGDRGRCNKNAKTHLRGSQPFTRSAT